MENTLQTFARRFKTAPFGCRLGRGRDLAADRSTRSQGPKLSDSVSLAKSPQANNPYTSFAPSSARVSVQKWGSGKNDCLSSILKGQGYTHQEMYRKDQNGKTLLDKVAAQNNLRDPNLVGIGQELVVPTKAKPQTCPQPTPARTCALGTKPAANQSATRRDEVLRDMLNENGFSSDDFRKLSNSLSNYSVEDLEGLKEMGVKIGEATQDQLEQTTRRMRSRFGKGASPAGWYNEARNELLLKPGILDQKIGSHVIHHELGHAMDDLRQEDPSFLGRLGTGLQRLAGADIRSSGYESTKDREFSKLYDGYLERTKGMKREGGTLWSNYARTNAAEYYAEGMALYTQGGEKRQRLARLDPELFAYLNNRA
jgi:hypothetical protein